jgi:2,3-bisphosphoglycerate-independent phosphoglycerate mutase
MGARDNRNCRPKTDLEVTRGERSRMMKKPIMLTILDGWGLRGDRTANAVALAQTPFLDQLMHTYPVTRLTCSGEAVGLPGGIMGNSEVGHLNIGAGRVVYQDLLRIDKAIAEGIFFENPVINHTIQSVRKADSALHLMGLVSDGGVHSQLTHLLALIDLARQKGLSKVFVHAILDGRDTAPDAGRDYLGAVQAHLDKTGCGAIASVCGRFYAMDRDKRWERIEKAYRLYATGQGRKAQDAVQAVNEAYAQQESDEFIQPIVVVDDRNAPLAPIGDGDGVIFFNFRADRAREITRVLTDPNFNEFARPNHPHVCDYACMTNYDETFTLPIAFPPVHLEGILGEVISRHGLHQLRIAETEKYAHVTYFFNGGEEKPFELEDRCLIPSPRDVPTYDHKPEMSAHAVTDEVIQRIQTEQYAFIVLNFANMDMVGHTGVLEAAVKACETVDRCLARIVPEVLSRGGAMLITADHGNAETMAEENGHVHTAHTTNPVPLVLVDDSHPSKRLREGILGDIAPTILDLMGLEKPAQMTGNTLMDHC